MHDHKVPFSYKNAKINISSVNRFINQIIKLINVYMLTNGS